MIHWPTVRYTIRWVVRAGAAGVLAFTALLTLLPRDVLAVRVVAHVTAVAVMFLVVAYAPDLPEDDQP